MTTYIAAILLAMLLTHCIHTEYIEKPVVPSLDFPIFPTLENEIRNDNGTVTVSGEWIVNLAEYKIRIEETEKTYSELKELYTRDKYKP